MTRGWGPGRGRGPSARGLATEAPIPSLGMCQDGESLKDSEEEHVSWKNERGLWLLCLFAVSCLDDPEAAPDEPTGDAGQSDTESPDSGASGSSADARVDSDRGSA